MLHTDSDLFSEVFLAMCKSADTPTALKLYLLYKHKDYVQLLKTKVHPMSYVNVDDFQVDYLLVSFIKKYKGLQVEVDREKVALDTFKSIESRLLSNKASIISNLSTEGGVWYSVKSMIARILGPSPVLESQRECTWTTGSSTDISKRRMFPDKRISLCPIPVTRSASSYLLRQIQFDPHWFEALSGVLPTGPYSPLRTLIKYEEACKIATVPKTSLTDRTIGIEPRGNMFLQKGVGNFLRRRLKKFGCDLDDQSLNQGLAQRAFSSKLATIDLEGASDSFSSELLHLLFPPDFANYIDDIRCKYYLLGTETHRFNKVSSMGNGFTFELESLLFYCIAMVTSEFSEDCSVYGDDIIVPQQYVSSTIEALVSCGFVVNNDKSFTSGNFFESCGRHYWKERDVTPIYQKENVGDDVEKIRFFNRIFRLRSRLPTHSQRIADNACSIIRRRITPFSECRIPSFCEGDDGYLTRPEELTYVRNRGWKSTVIRYRMNSYPGYNRAMYAYNFRQSLSAESPTYGDIFISSKVPHIKVVYIEQFG